MEEYPKAVPVTFSLRDLEDVSRLPSLFPRLSRAFGADGAALGILVVTGLPADFAQLRRRVLSYASVLGNAPIAVREGVEVKEAKYLVGWSCGKESFRGKPDTLKGSFYYNPTSPAGATLPNGGRPSASGDAGGTDEFAEYTTANVWPKASHHGAEALDGMQHDCEALGRLMVDVGRLVARACDAYVRSIATSSTDGNGEGAESVYDGNYLEDMIASSTTTKARLLHYYPAPPSDVEEGAGGGAGAGDAEPLDSWCGEHLDHGCLTALTSAMYVDESHTTFSSDGGSVELPELPQAPDARSGLYIRDRADRIFRVGIPKDAIAFQTGEALQVTTRGRLRAVPHFVVGNRAPPLSATNTPGAAEAAGVAGAAKIDAGGAKKNGAARVARNTLAVFMQPNLADRLGPAAADGTPAPTFAEFARGVVDANYGVAAA